ncbi:MXAN_5187 C-terminal domain-containing protein [Trichloromonas sp.]|uniref:MXAN_5187 C-terminal domain-containing protein n=1 Tax=Trichloromonas sp. TaxID=3069249 RepID=UPI002A45EBD4|nr:MXAN_5187 C-terminal domain-containing protein [Trichloromonas sp.]
MNDRVTILRELGEVEQELKELEILYEQYFAGVEKREPVKQREALARRLRRFVNRRIIQTDARFRYQTLAARYHSYASHWDRILRLIDEGRYHRQTAHMKQTPAAAAEPVAVTAPPVDPCEKIYQDLVAARQSCGIAGPPPDPRQVALFLENQKDKIREKFGDREVEFRVEIEDGKPKIKVRAKK